jgi:2Fe-2S ferredoxin
LSRLAERAEPGTLGSIQLLFLGLTAQHNRAIAAMRETITVYFISHAGPTTSVETKAGQSLMQAATAKNLAGIAADCGGLMTCATCHVLVDEPFASQLAKPEAEELAMLAFTAIPRLPNSRLSCQITLSSELNGLTVTLPASQY